MLAALQPGGRGGAARTRPGPGRLDELAADARAAGLGGDADRTGDAGRCPAEVGPGRVPDRPGGADQRAPARRAGGGGRRSTVGVRAGRRSPCGSTTPGPAPSGVHIGRQRDRRHAGAGAGAGRHARRGRPDAPAAGFRRGRPAACPPTREDDAMIRVLLADDQALVRAGFRALLDAEPDIEVVGEAGDGAAAVRLAARDPARRGPDGHPDAAGGRAGGDPPDRRRPGAGRRPHRHPDHVRPRRVRVRGAAGRARAASWSRTPSRSS